MMSTNNAPSNSGALSQESKAIESPPGKEQEVPLTAKLPATSAGKNDDSKEMPSNAETVDGNKVTSSHAAEIADCSALTPEENLNDEPLKTFPQKVRYCVMNGIIMIHEPSIPAHKTVGMKKD